MIWKRKRTSRQWCKRLKFKREWIYDPDGWDRMNFEYSFNKEKITEGEFGNRVIRSTLMISVEGRNILANLKLNPPAHS